MTSDEGVHVDPERGKRMGIPEVVLALGKENDILLRAAESLLKAHPVLVTRATEQQIELLLENFSNNMDVEVNKLASSVKLGGRWDHDVGSCVVITAGSSDIRAAEEAAFSLEYMGIEPVRAYDRGVAGMHRTEEVVAMLRNHPSRGVIVVAGMEGALPSVVAGQVSQPVVAVPTSVGYGSSFQGLSALLGMMNSCVPGMVVVNIDNGFGAASAMYRIMKLGKTDKA